MNLEFRNNKDFWAGMMFFGIGLVSICIARNYPFGTSLRMGPGYFPTVLGGLLFLFGIYLILRGLRTGEKIGGVWSVRALIMLPLALVAYGVFMERLGFLPALAALIFASSASGREFKFIEVLLLTVFLSAISVALFVWDLGLPYPLFKFF